MKKTFLIIFLFISFVINIIGCGKMDAKTKIKIASYNVQCLSYGAQLSQISEEIININPDIIGIQELDYNTGRTKNTNQLELLAQAAGYEYYFFSKTIDFDGGEYGHGIMSKYPIARFETKQFSIQGNETRCFSRAEIEINGETIVFYNTHLDFGSNMQVKQLAEIIDLAQDDKYSIITGDMNCMPSAYKNCLKNKYFISLNGGESFSDFINTCPEGKNSIEPIDNIIVSKSFDCYYDENTQSNLIINKTINSDHNMIYTYLEF